MIHVKLGARGEIVIPKKIRDHLGLAEGQPVILNVKDDAVEIKAPRYDLVERWEARAKKYHADVGKWVMGDKLYEEEF